MKGLTAIFLLLMGSAFAQDAEPVSEASADDAVEQVEDEVDSEEPVNGDGLDQPRTMSGMSILGNEEAPKSLVIIPWKTSEIGDELSLLDTLDDRARPVDKEVFLRELDFYAIRSSD